MNDDSTSIIGYIGMALIVLSVIALVGFGMYTVGRHQQQRQSAYEQAQKITTKQAFNQALNKDGQVIAVSTKLSGDTVQDPNVGDNYLYVRQTHDEQYVTMIPISTGKTTTMVPQTNTETITDYTHHGKNLEIFGQKFSYGDVDYKKLIKDGVTPANGSDDHDYDTIKNHSNVSFIARVHNHSLESVDGSSKIKLYNMNQDSFHDYMTR